MNTFNNKINALIYEYADILGNSENIFIGGVGETTCKIDTGNIAYNVLHGVNIKINGNNVEFDTINNKRIIKQIVDNVIINIGSGIKEERPIILFNVKLGNEEYPKVKFTISDRTENSEPVLLGKEFLSILDKLIDVNKDFTVS